MSMSFDEWYDKGRLTLASIQNPQIYSEDNSNKENMRHAWYSGIAHIIGDICGSDPWVPISIEPQPDRDILLYYPDGPYVNINSSNLDDDCQASHWKYIDPPKL